MVKTQRLDDVAVYNERSLKALDRAISLSRGEFSLVLVRCNYKRLRDRILHQLRQLSQNHYEIRELTLPESVTTLYTTIQSYGNRESGIERRDGRQGGQGGQGRFSTDSLSCLSPPASSASPAPPALFILGLESVTALDDLLASTNQVRDEFRKRLPFPLVLWVNDEVLHKFWRLAPDFASWAATPIKFEIATDELIDFLRQKADALFKIILNGGTGRYAPWRVCMHHSTLNLATGCRSRLELETALQDLQSRQEVISPELDASLLFVLGQYDYASDLIDSAIVRYQQSLRYWRVSNHLERQGVLLFYIGLCYCRQADLQRSQRQRNLEEAWPYLQQCVQVFTEARRPDLVAQFITQLAEVLQSMKAWSALQVVALQALPLHQTDGSPVQLAQDYGFLAEVALSQSRWEEAQHHAQQAIALLAEISSQPSQHQGLHRFLLTQLYQLFLVKSQRKLGQLPEAEQQLERASQELRAAIEASDHRYEPRRYLHLLEQLRTFYFEQGRYLEAFRIKQEQRAVEQLYGFRAFIGAGRLQPQRSITNPTLTPVEQQEIVAQEIAASGRQQDVNRLIERLTRSDRKLTIIHGQSGVGKSSIVSAGLVPALKYRTLGDRIALPVVVQVYTDWIRELGKSLSNVVDDLNWSDSEQRANLEFNDLRSPQDKIQSILTQLRQNANHNLLTVLIFDQFEEFLFVSNSAKRRLFYEFLRDCLNLPFVKVIFSIREDYLHYLLEIEQLNLEVIDNNILDKKIRYPLGNFSITDAHSVITSLTERAQFYLEPALIDELVKDLAGELGTVRPIELQVVGSQLQNRNITTLALYKQQGSKAKLVEQYLEEVVKDCGAENENAAWIILYLLTDENDNRPLKTPGELATESGLDTQQLDLILEILEKSGLIFLLPEVPANRYQLIHDYLVEFIRHKKQLKIQLELEELRQKDRQSQDKIEQLRAELREKELRARLAEATKKQRHTEDKLNHVLRQSLQEARLVGVTLAALTIVAGGLWLRAAMSEMDARLSALNASSEALVASNKSFDALLESIKAGKKLKWSIGAKSETRMRIVTSLQQLVYGIRERNRLEGHTGWVSSVDFSSDGKTIITASEDGTIKIWKADGTFIKDIGHHQAGVYSVSFSPNGKLIASASKDKTVKLWNSQGVLLKTLKGHRDRVRSLSFSPDSKLLATGSEDKTVKLWSADGFLLKTLPQQNDSVFGVSFSPNGEFIASVGRDGKIELWSNKGTLLKSWNAPNNAQVMSVSFSPDSQTLATASRDSIVSLWRIDGTLLDTLKGHSDAALSVSFSPDGTKIATASRDSTVKLWRSDGTFIETFKGHSSSVLGVSFSPDGKTLASASADYTVKLWSSDGGMLKPIEAHTDKVSSVSFSSDNQTIATASWDKTIKLWRRDGVLLKTFVAHNDRVRGVSFSPNGKMIASASADHTVKLWTSDGTFLRTLLGHQNDVLSVSFSPNNQLIATASADSSVKLWKIDGTLLNTLEGHQSKVWGVSFSPDGQLIASASADRTVKIWNRNGKLLHTLKGHNDSVNWVSFSPDGQLIASASDDGTIRLWRRDGKLYVPPFRGHNGAVNWVSFSSDGQLIAAANRDGTVNLWTRNGKSINTLKGHSDAVFGVSFSRDGKLLASVSEDHTLILWNLDLEDLLMRGCSWLQDYLNHHQSVSEENSEDSRDWCEGNW